MPCAPLAVVAALCLVLCASPTAARDGLSVVVPTTADDRWRDRFEILEEILAPSPVEFLDQSVLGREINVLTALQQGFADFAVLSAATLIEVDERFLVANLPLVAVELSLSRKALDETIVNEALNSAAEAGGLAILGRFARPSVLGSRVECVKVPEQLLGYRVVAFGAERALLLRAGASPISISAGEISVAIDRGLAEKALVAAETAHDLGLAETWNCMTRSSPIPLTHSWSFLVVRDAVLGALSEEQAERLHSAAADMMSEEEVSQARFLLAFEEAMAPRGLADFDEAAWRELGQAHYAGQAASVVVEVAKLVRAVARILEEDR